MTQDPMLEEHLQMQRDAQLGAAVRAAIDAWNGYPYKDALTALNADIDDITNWNEASTEVATILHAIVNILEAEAADGSG